MSFIKRFNAMIIIFLGLIVFSGANTNVSNDYISSTGPFYYCSLDSEFQFGEHIYSRADSTTSYEQEKLIGFLIREEDEDQIIKQEGYLYGIVATSMSMITTKIIYLFILLLERMIINIFLFN